MKSVCVQLKSFKTRKSSFFFIYSTTAITGDTIVRVLENILYPQWQMTMIMVLTDVSLIYTSCWVTLSTDTFYGSKSLVLSSQIPLLQWKECLFNFGIMCVCVFSFGLTQSGQLAASFLLDSQPFCLLINWSPYKKLIDSTNIFQWTILAGSILSIVRLCCFSI